ncbi:hypothetical protein PUN28_002307 [Cardiocondyla obscurior]|uniref:Uncharacterized protein n=1 Tax=Cardiocondyla obscurior TaxID=286306 RepID=A0AAW2GTI8_9HYME
MRCKFVTMTRCSGRERRNIQRRRTLCFMRITMLSKFKAVLYYLDNDNIKHNNIRDNNNSRKEIKPLNTQEINQLNFNDRYYATPRSRESDRETPDEHLTLSVSDGGKRCQPVNEKKKSEIVEKIM